MVFDDARGVTVLFGGGLSPSDSISFGDTWHFDGVNWSLHISPQSPSRRYGHAMAFDRARSRTVLFGGSNTVAEFADTWEYDGATWTLATPPAAPAARDGTALAYDLRRRRCVLFGGENGNGLLLADTWQYDGTTWTQIAAASAPPARCAHTLVFDSARERTVLFGGQNLTTITLGDTWTFDGAVWFGTDLVQWNGAPLPFAPAPPRPDCLLWIGPAVSVALAHAGSTASFTLAIPASPSLAGFVLGMQALAFDAANPNSTALSNGLVAQVR